MNKTLGLVALGTVLALSSCTKKLGDFSADYFTTNPNPLEVVGEKVPATVTANIPPKFFVKNASVTVTPYLVYNGMETASPSFTFQGENVKGNAPVINYNNGGVVTIPVRYDYNPSMANSNLELAFEVTQGNNQYMLPRVTVANGVIGTAYMADARTIAPALLEDSFQAQIKEEVAADILFLINVANIRDNQLTTEQMTELWEQIRSTKDNPNIQLEGINIQAYASPDGTLAFNEALAQKREVNTNDYIKSQLKKDGIDFTDITKNFTAEDWAGLRELLAASNIQDKNLIISTLDNIEEPDLREAELRKLYEVYPEIVDQMLPQLRYSRITAAINIIGKSNEEILTYVQQSPDQLSIDELLYAATLVGDNSAKEAIYTKATEYYPNDYRGWNDLGLTQYVAGNVDAASKSFNKAKSLAGNNANVVMNQSLIELANGNYDAAKKLIGNAAGATGLEAALGTYYLKTGDNAAAAKAFADVVSNNAALSQILTKNYSKATSTLNAIAAPDATTYYLKAIVGARTNNENMVTSNLKKAIQLDKNLAAKAATDMEFANFAIQSLLGF